MDLLTGTWVPTWVMVVVVSVLTLSLIIGVPAARSAGKRRGMRLKNPDEYKSRLDKAKDTALFFAALLPSVLVWLAVMGVSFIGLTGFAEDVMGWHHWSNVLVPLSLDGISISFGAWAFVAVKRGRHPGRAYKIVLAAATVSATLNFVHGRDKWSLWAGLYLAFLSMVGMAMFHELLDQFMAAYDDELALRTRYPRFGQRWLYAPVSTFSARRAWIVHPPEDGFRPSVRNALDHLEFTRESKRQRRLTGAMHVRQEQQARLLEVQARRDVRRARLGQRVETLEPLPIPAPQMAPQMAAPQMAPQMAQPQMGQPMPHLAGGYNGYTGYNGAVPPVAPQASPHPAPQPMMPPVPVQAPIPAQQTPPRLMPDPPNPYQTMPPQLLPQRAEVVDDFDQEEFERQFEAPYEPPKFERPMPMPEPEFRPSAAANHRPLVHPSAPPRQEPPARSSLTDTGSQPLFQAIRAEVEFPSNTGREALGRSPLWDQYQGPTQAMIEDVLAHGDTPTLPMVRDWVLAEFGHKPSDHWVRSQIKAVRSKDRVGADFDAL